MLDVADPIVHWGYFFLALIGSLAYGLDAFVAFGVPRSPKPPNYGAWLHQVWFNVAGAGVGWLAGWVVLVRWLSCERSVCPNEPRFSTIFLLGVAFMGVTGHLPFTIARGLHGLSVLMRWFGRHVHDPPGPSK